MFKLKAAIVKDFRVLLRDRIGLAFMFLMPVVLVIVVTNIQSSTFQLLNKNKLNVLLLNRDTGRLSKEFIQTLDKTGLFRVNQLPPASSDADLREGLHKKDALLAIAIPSTFTNDVLYKAKSTAGKAMKSFGLEGDSAKHHSSNLPLDVFYQPSLPESYHLSVQGAVRSAVQIVESKETLRQLYLGINDKPLPAKMENELLQNQTQIRERSVAGDRDVKTPDATQHNVPAWTIFAMFFVIISLAGSIIREKRSGSFVRLKTLPTSYALALFARQLTYLLVTILQALVVFAIGIWLFPLIGLPGLYLPHDIVGFFVVTLIIGWAAVSYAVCAGVFFNTEEQANSFGAISIVILAALGGLMVPSFAMPSSFSVAINLSPLHWCLEAYNILFLENGRLADAASYLLPLMIMILVMQAIAFAGLKRKNLI